MSGHASRGLHRLRHERDAGTNLVELAITMMIMGIVIAATATLVIGAQRTNAQTISRLDQIESARNAVERMSETLRTAVMPSQLLRSCPGCTEDAFIRGENYAVQFYANIDNPANSVGPSRVTYSIVTTGTGVGSLVQRTQIPDSPVPSATGYQYCDPSPAASPTPECLARVKDLTIAEGVLTTTGTPLIRYFDNSGVALVPSGGALTATQLGNVVSVELTATVQQQNAVRARPTTYIQRLLLPNAQAVIRQGEDTP